MNRWLTSSGLIALLSLGVALSAFIVPEGMQAQVNATSPWLAPGLHWHWPNQAIRWRDQRQHVLLATGTNDQPYIAVSTFDHQNLQLGYVSLWKVIDPAVFEAKFSDEAAANADVRMVVNQILSQCCLSQTLAQWLKPDSLPGIVDQAMAEANKRLMANGIQVSQLQITALVVPMADRDLWLAGMKSRGQQALDQLQVQTSTLAAQLKAEVDNKVVQTLANAKQQADQWRLKAETQATAVYAQAYNKNPSFYEFYNNLKLYQQVFKSQPPILVLDSNDPFLKSMKGS